MKRNIKKNMSVHIKSKVKNIKQKLLEKKAKKIKRVEGITLKKSLFFIPSLITCGSILCGLWAIFLCLTTSSTETAIILVILAGFLDAFDGRTARFLGVSGNFGIELDSLADFLSFGVAPMIIYFYSFEWNDVAKAFAFLSMFPVFMSLRLARFNMLALEPIKNKRITDFRKNFFFGLAAPVGAVALMLPLISSMLGYWSFTSSNYAIIYAFVIALFLVIPVPIFSHKMLHFNFKKKTNTVFAIFVIVFLSCAIYRPLYCIFVVSFLYIMTIPVSFVVYNKGMAKIEREEYGE